ncbi:myotubularin-like protein [Plasmopara halstedii]|uniref:Myotubularin-like protein n=1 Tax=Plasmopara halstedii TaxID=4781 RepID=A0A0N7L564_PLAHL|nr:myotubularin-like protein [Plasmopara halstedii]CEG40603.1 myotubularin-like protein [Plasmopara halstedii]|eukprot:XP_024576972.1 myotubularin-like protein [Plasmopara halstedii]
MVSERDSDIYVDVTHGLDETKEGLSTSNERQHIASDYTSRLFPRHVQVISPTSTSSNGSGSEPCDQKHRKRAQTAAVSTSGTATETDSDLEESRSDTDKEKVHVIRSMHAAQDKQAKDDSIEVINDEECKGLGELRSSFDKDQERFELAIALDFETDTNAASSVGRPSVTRQTSSSFSDLGDFDDFSFSDAITIPNGGGSGSVASSSNSNTPTTFYPIYGNDTFRFTHTSVSNCGYGSYDAIEKIPGVYTSPVRSARSANSPTILRLDSFGCNDGRLTPTFQLTQPADESQPLVGDIYPVSGEVVRLRVDNCAYIIFYKSDDSGEEQTKSELLGLSSSSDEDANECSEDGSGKVIPPRSYVSLGAAGHKVQTDNCFTRDYNHPTRSLGRGLFRASTSVGNAFMKGAAGLVNKTYQGGASGGVFGFAKGLGMGMLGLGTHTVKGAFRGVGQVTHLVGEMVLGTAPHFSIDGTLVLTNYRIIWQALSTKDAMEIPLATILSAESSTTAPHVANIEGKHLLRASLAFQNETTCSDFLNCIWELYSSGTSPPHYLFAHLHYQALRHKDEAKTVNGTGLETPSDLFYDAEEDYRRLKLLDENSWMRLYDNSDYAMFPSYPNTFVIPSVLDQDDLRQLSAYRSASRIAAVVWRHPHTGALVCRCAQPCTGLSGYVVAADQKLVSALQHATSTYGDAKFHFFDARSQMAATANSAQGKGTEDPRNYPNSELHFCDIANIHAVRSSYASLAEVCQPGQERESSGWLFQLRSTFWFLHLSNILSTAQEICRCLNQGHSVMIHCSDGWDRTPQLTSMLELLLDPYYRTLRGWLCLIEKEWCSFGHLFRHRYGHGEGPGQQELEEQSPVFIQWLDAVWQIWRQQPWAFEFNEALLSALYDCIFSGLYGNFLYDSERQRNQEEAKVPTRSLWFVLLEQANKYLNAEYDSAKNFNSIGLVLPFSSEENDLVMWDNHLTYADPVCRKYE